MPDSLLQTIAQRLGLNVPSAPAPDPIAQALYDQKAKQTMGPVAQAMDWAGGHVPSFVHGLVSGDVLPSKEQIAADPSYGYGALAGAMLPFGEKGIPGMYSRLERLVESLPSAINAGKLNNILNSGRVAKEELNWRKVPEFLSEYLPNKTVSRDALVEHLKANPLDVRVVDRTDTPPSPDDIDTGLRPLDDYLNNRGTRWDDYTMEPGSSNYHETMIQLMPNDIEGTGGQPGRALVEEDGNRFDVLHIDPRGTTRRIATYPTTEEADAHALRLDPQYRPDMSLADVRKLMGNPKRDFVSHHTDVPNTVVMVRHNERTLPIGYDQLVASHPEIQAIQKEVAGLPIGDPRRNALLNRQDEITGGLMRQEKANIFRTMENIQSDWEQRGAHGGYSDDPAAAPKAHDAALAAASDRYLDTTRKAVDWLNQNGYGDIYGPFHESDVDAAENIPDVTHVRDALGDVWRNGHKSPEHKETARALIGEVEQARVAHDNALDAVHRSMGSVPDMPFKGMSAPPELALKQQLLDIAHNAPYTKGIVIAPSSELNARGEGISPAFQDKMLPSLLEKLLRPFGGKVEQAPIADLDTVINPVTMSNTHDLGKDQLSSEWAEIRRTNRPLSARYRREDEWEPVASTWPRRHMVAREGADADYLAKPLMEVLKQNRPDLFKPVPLKADIIRFTPEMLDQIRQKGFPLLTTLLAARLAASHPQDANAR